MRKTAATRVARAVARRLHCALLLRYSNGNDMASPLDGVRFAGWTYRRDANGTKEIAVTPEDTPEMLARLDRVIEADSIAEMMRARIASVLASPPPAGGGSTLIAEAIERYGRRIRTRAVLPHRARTLQPVLATRLTGDCPGRSTRRSAVRPWLASTMCWRAHRAASTTRCVCSPRLSMPRRMTSPARRYSGGFWPRPTPGGVPVEMTSPDCRLMKRLR